MGIEPTTTAWEAVVLPLNYVRIFIYYTYYIINKLYFQGGIFILTAIFLFFYKKIIFF